jgi:hypothetical protein
VEGQWVLRQLPLALEILLLYRHLRAITEGWELILQVVLTMVVAVVEQAQ